MGCCCDFPYMVTHFLFRFAVKYVSGRSSCAQAKQPQLNRTKEALELVTKLFPCLRRYKLIQRPTVVSRFAVIQRDWEIGAWNILRWKRYQRKPTLTPRNWFPIKKGDGSTASISINNIHPHDLRGVRASGMLPTRKSKYLPPSLFTRPTLRIPACRSNAIRSFLLAKYNATTTAASVPIADNHSGPVLTMYCQVSSFTVGSYKSLTCLAHFMFVLDYL